MSKVTIDTSTSRATPTPVPGKRMTVPSLRARIAGTVVRLPGTGDGVARLVLVSMVKVDMGGALAKAR